TTAATTGPTTRPNITPVTRNPAAATPAAPALTSPAAIGRCRFRGCRRSAFRSARSLTRYVPPAAAQKASTVIANGTNPPPRRTVPLATGAANTTRFLTHWAGRADLTIADAVPASWRRMPFLPVTTPSPRSRRRKPVSEPHPKEQTRRLLEVGKTVPPMPDSWRLPARRPWLLPVPYLDRLDHAV